MNQIDYLANLPQDRKQAWSKDNPQFAAEVRAAERLFKIFQDLGLENKLPQKEPPNPPK